MNFRMLRRRTDRGSILVESVFVFPIVIILTFAVIEFGLAFATTSTSTASSRTGARYASAKFAVESDKQAVADEIALEVEQELGALTELGTPQTLWIYRVDPASTDGAPIGGFGGTCTTDCFRYTWTGSSFVPVVGSSWNDPDACENSAVAGVDVDTIGVRVEVAHAMITGFFGSTFDIKEHTTLLLEPLPSEDC